MSTRIESQELPSGQHRAALAGDFVRRSADEANDPSAVGPMRRRIDIRGASNPLRSGGVRRRPSRAGRRTSHAGGPAGLSRPPKSPTAVEWRRRGKKRMEW